MTETGGAPRSAEGSGGARLVSLDGLRGVASVVVVLSHLALTFRPFSDAYIVPQSTHPRVGSATWWLTSTPAELAIAGSESVLVFFVLSGLVLTLPALRGGFRWGEYYPRRVVRLYLPAIASVLLGELWIVATSWSTARPTSLWVEEFRLVPDWRQTLSGFDLLFGDISVNNPLWSLRWEVVFSLLLPVFVLLARVVTRRWYLGIVAAFIAIAVGQLAGIASLQFLPVFLLGAIVATRLERMRAWVDDHRRGALVGGAVLLVAGLLLLDVHWTGWAVLGGAPRHQWLLLAAESLGALALVLVAALWRPAISLLSTALFRWLGRVSFSLYLVHVPIIIGLDALFGSWQPVLRVALSFVLALGVAELFGRFVEQPAHRLSKRVGRWAVGLLDRRPAQTSAATSDGAPAIPPSH